MAPARLPSGAPEIAPHPVRARLARSQQRILPGMSSPVRNPAPHSRGIMLVPVGHREPKHTGWTVFAGLMLLLAGTLNLVWGCRELVTDYYFSGDPLMT